MQVHAEITDAGPEQVFRPCIRVPGMQVRAGHACLPGEGGDSGQSVV